MDGDITWTFHRQMDQQVELRAGGKPYPGRLDLVRFNVSAHANNYNFTHETPPYEAYNAGAMSNNLITVLGEAADVNGNILNADTVPSSIQVVTPAAPGASKQINLNAVQSAIIIRNGQPITWKTNRVVIGELIDLKCELATNIATITAWQWNGMQGAVSNFAISADQRTGKVYYLTNASDFTTNEIKYHYVKPGLEQASCTVTVAGKQLPPARTSFNVVAPTYSLQLCPSNTVRIHGPYQAGPNNFHFGDGMTNAGMNFFADPVGLVETNFAIGFLQVGNSSSQRFYPSSQEQRVATSYTFLDNDAAPGDFLYPATARTNAQFGPFTNALFTTDSPGQSTYPELPTLTRITRSDSFTMFLMYKTGKGGIWVPLVNLPWSWSGTAEWTTQWSLTASNYSPTSCTSASGSGTGTFPIWSDKWNPFVKTNWTSF